MKLTLVNAVVVVLLTCLALFIVFVAMGLVDIGDLIDVNAARPTSRARDIYVGQCHTNGQTILQIISMGDYTTPSGTVFEIYSVNDGIEVNTNITFTITVDLENRQAGNFSTSAPLSPGGSYFLKKYRYPYAYFDC